MKFPKKELKWCLILGFKWNWNPKPSSDLLEKIYNMCRKVHYICALNGVPNPDKMATEKEHGISVGKLRIGTDDEEKQ